ncbi:MAG TPA: alpha/beta hydrolase [Acidobacteriaceae bacterium]|nr:alpha/beta hydrolase [Acidobacteriaceae bacterium]
MRDASQCSRAIFLHGGPGFSAELERRRYAERLPVHWWDQPRLASDAVRPFDALVEAAREQLVGLSERRGAPVTVLASSFGTFIARELLAAIPERIESVTFSAGLLDIRLPFVRWGRWRAKRLADPALETASQAAAVSNDPDVFWKLIGHIVAMPDFFDDYWGPESLPQRAAMRALAAEGPMFDLATFRAVMNDMLSPARPSPARMPSGDAPEEDACATMEIPVRVLIGTHDLLAEKADVGAWRALFPSATIDLVDCGHFPHLELPPEAWMP